MKRSLQNRILSFVLAALMTCSSWPFPASSVENAANDQNSTVSSGAPVYDDTTLRITQNGAPVQEMTINDHERVEISADGVENAARYQWQVLHPENDALWVNVLDATAQTIGVSAALVGNVLRADGTAQLRCCAYMENYVYQTQPVTVTISNDLQSKTSQKMLATMSNDLVSDSVDPLSGQLAEFVTITVNYVRYDYETGTDQWQEAPQIAYDPYEATLLYGGPLGNSETQTGLTIPIPSMIGYEPYLANQASEPLFEDATYSGISVNREQGQQTTIYIAYQANITQNIELTIHYMPANVDYAVHYFFQNIYDDNYVEDVGMAEVGTGRTGSYPDSELVQKKFDGFTAMYYEPAAIAADGTTVFEVYYERNYYLMDLHCNGGYGASPVYVRYEAYISVPNPVRPGWSFQGWDMTGAWDDANYSLYVKMEDGNLVTTNVFTEAIKFEDSVKDNLPITMPCFNTSFAATWTEADTSYTVAYWIKDDQAGGNNHTFLGSRTIDARTGDSVEIQGDYAQPVVCGGLTEHAEHIDACYDCGKSVHVHHNAHELSCHSFVTSWSVLGAGDDQNVIDDANTRNSVTTPNDGDIYFIRSSWRTTEYWPKMYWDGVYYTILIDGRQAISEDEISNYTVGGQVGEPGEITVSGGTLYAYRYKAIMDCPIELCADPCPIEAHTHDDCTTICGLQVHTHTESCYFELGQYVEFNRTYTEEQKNQYHVNTVAGDGSTVLNEYYDYKTYEIRFVYARSSQGTDSIIYEVASLTNNGSLTGCQWSTVTVLPTVQKYPTGQTQSYTFLDDNNVYTYYYIYLRAKYNADIYDLWPAANMNDIDSYIWGSWASEDGSPYRVQHQNNANIMGIYPTLSAELINDDAEIIYPIQTTDQTGNTVSANIYLAQTMVAWWGTTSMSISPHAYHNYLEVLSLPEAWTSTDGWSPADVSSDGRVPTEYDGKYYIKREYSDDGGNTVYKYYELLNDQFVSNHDDWTRVYPAEFIGYDLYDRASHEGQLAKNFANNDACTVCGQNCDYCNVFLYDRTIHYLKFWNVNRYLSDGSGSPVRYGASLAAHGAYFASFDMNTSAYPSIYEKGAYEFVDWYLTPNFAEGTQVTWDTTVMPDADFTVYAKWEPVKHTVCFYLDYDQLQAGTLLAITDKDGYAKDNPMEVTHNESLTFQLETPTRNGYIFMGWFYMDGVEKKRFSPETMGFKQDMNLFGEWYAINDQSVEYTVHYCLTDGTEIAPSITGHSSVGRTKTFHAVGGDDLYEGYRTGYFPEVASHSLLTKPEDPNDPNANSWTFEYVQDDLVYYKIIFLNVADQTVLRDEIIKSTNQAVVTERFMPIDGYVPLPGYFYQTKSLQADGDVAPDGENNVDVNEANVITFYYIEDTEHGIYSIEYYLEDLTASGQTTTYSLMTSITNTADLFVADQPNVIDSGDEFEVLSFDGFTFEHADVITYTEGEDADGNDCMVPNTTTVTTQPISGELYANGLTIKLYYSRNDVAYTVKYVDNETGDVIYTTDTKSGDVVTKLTAPFGSEITHTAPAEYPQNSQNPTHYYFQKDATDEERTKTMKLRTPNVNTGVANEMVFYYVKPVLTIYYVAVCHIPDITGFGGVTYSSETSSSGTITGSTAIPAYGFSFVGWYKEEACTTPAINDETYKNAAFKPTSWPEGQDSVTYYALFEPQFTSITIKNDVNDDSTTDNFLVRIQGTGKTAYVDTVVSFNGNGKIVLENVPVGVYTITLLTNWSWTYTTSETIGYTGCYTQGVLSTPIIASGGITFETSIPSGDPPEDVNVITFTSSANAVDWLNGESSQENP